MCKRPFGLTLALLLLLVVPAWAQGGGQFGGSGEIIRCVIEQQNVNRTLEGTNQPIRCSRDGALIEMPWRYAVSLEGRVFVVNFGQGTTTLTGTTTLSNTTPLANLDVPSGAAVIPIKVQVAPITNAGTSSQVFCSVTSTLIGSAFGGTTASSGPTNLRTDAPFGSRTTARQCSTGTCTAGAAQTVLYEFTSWGGAGTASGAWAGNMLYLPESPPIVVGPGAINCYATGATTAPVVKIIMTFVELPVSTVQ